MTTAHAPDAKRAPARDDDTAAEQPVAGDTWRSRARQLLRARAIAAFARARRVLLATAAAAIDTGIALLQRLRQRAGGAAQPDERRDHDRERPATRATTVRPKGNPAAEEPVAPKPRRRLRGVFVYLGVMLAGAMGGMALAYDLFAQMLDRQSVQIKRQDFKMSKDSKVVAEMEKKLEQRHLAQIEAERRLAAALAQNEKQLGELQAQRAEAQTRLASVPIGRASNPQRQEDTSGNRGGGAAARSGQVAWTRAGNCTLGSANIRSVLKGCIAEMDRR